MSEPIMTLDELMDKVPEPWRPVVKQYGPALLSMGVEELWNWIDMAAQGNIELAYKSLLRRLDNSDLLKQWKATNDAWKAANKRNTLALAVQQEALAAILRASLSAALILVGL